MIVDRVKSGVCAAWDRVKGVGRWAAERARGVGAAVIVGAAGLAVGTHEAAAAPAITPAEMNDIVFPVDIQSLISKVVFAQGTILALVFGVILGVTLLWALFRRVKRV